MWHWRITKEYRIPNYLQIPRRVLPVLNDETLSSCGQLRRLVNSDKKTKKKKNMLLCLSEEWRCCCFLALNWKTGSLNADVSSVPPRWPHMRRELGHLLELGSEQVLRERAKWRVEREPNSVSFRFATASRRVDAATCSRNSNRR